jgi:uncharacterized membrane protein YoaK (UPF0700 family)
MISSINHHKQTVRESLVKTTNKNGLKQLFSFHTAAIQSYNRERLIHCIVTMTVGIGLLISSITTLAFQLIMLWPIDILLLLLFVPYIYHYYRLENAIQGLYPITEEIQKRIEDCE